MSFIVNFLLHIIFVEIRDHVTKLFRAGIDTRSTTSSTVAEMHWSYSCCCCWLLSAADSDLPQAFRAYRAGDFALTHSSHLP